jgi:hypothetical protein
MSIKAFIRASGFLILAFLLSCEDTALLINCEDCNEEEPQEATLEIKLEDNPVNFSPSVLVSIYEGNIEDNALLTSFRTFGSSSSYSVVLNKKYSVTATYLTNNGTTYIAVDSATPKVRYEKSQCDEKCYFVYDKVIDLRIKYTK